MTLRHFSFFLGRVERVTASARCLCIIHGEISIGEKGFDVFAVVWRERDANADSDFYFMSEDIVGFGDGAQNALCDDFSMVRIDCTRQKQCKLVAAKPGQMIGLPDRAI